VRAAQSCAARNRNADFQSAVSQNSVLLWPPWTIPRIFHPPSLQSNRLAWQNYACARTFRSARRLEICDTADWEVCVTSGGRLTPVLVTRISWSAAGPPPTAPIP